MNTECIRFVLRLTVAASWLAGAAVAVHSLTTPHYISMADLWRGLILLAVVNGTWMLTEVMITCKEQILAAQPSAEAIAARAIVAALRARDDDSATADVVNLHPRR